MVAHFISVGQGDSTLLEFPCGAILIDAGAQDAENADKLTAYLTAFFQHRPDLTNTLESIIITHPHKDHTFALRKIVEGFHVKHFVDNGQNAGSGIAPIRWVRSVAAARHISVRQILNSEVMTNGNHAGLTDGDIDPVSCPNCDPKISVLSGQWPEDRSWGHEEFDNKNNHSVVVRVAFGDSRFLFSGDLETPAIKDLVDYYDPMLSGTSLLDVDVYHVGHHGSDNGTTIEFLQAMTPTIAIISMGQWNDGQNTASPFTTWRYGHPRKVTVDLLSATIPGARNDALPVKVAIASKNFQDFTVRKRIYATAWDGNVKIGATLTGNFTVSRNN